MELREGDVRWFHYRDGVYFVRQQDGAVRIQEEVDGVTIAEVVIDPHSWSSVVASMSALGEDAKTYEAARDFHGFDTQKVPQ